MNQNPITQAIAKGFGIGNFSNILNWAIGIAMGIAIALIIYGGILYTVSGGNKSLATEGKKWISAAIYGVVLLFAAFLLLNTINPQILQIKNPGLQQITLPTSTPPQIQTSALLDSATLAGEILNDPNIVLNGPGDGCDSSSANPGKGKSNPYYSIADTASGLLPYVCAVPSNNNKGDVGSCNCTRGGPYGTTYLNPGLLQGLLDLANSGYKFYVTALTSGMHNGTSDYSTYHGHYSGEAVDLVPDPAPTTANQWIKFRDAVQTINTQDCNASESFFFCESSGINGQPYSNCAVPQTTHVHWTCARM